MSERERDAMNGHAESEVAAMNGGEEMNGGVEVNGHEDREASPPQVAAYANNLRAHRVGISPSEVIKAYDAWADKYDNDLCPGVYNGPLIAAQALAEVFPCERRAGVKILDVAAGTGRVGLELHALGFRNLDALEPSRWMREQCRGRGLYLALWEDLIGDTPTSIPGGSYDAVVVAGGMGEGHIPVRGLPEMARLVKKGGLVCVVMREEYLQTVAEYAGRLEPFLQSLVEDGSLQKVSRTVVPNYSFNKNGVVYLYQVL